MPIIIDGPPEPPETRRAWGSRVLWFVGLALGSGTATAIVAYALKALLPS
jgi:hypothetical protein